MKRGGSLQRKTPLRSAPKGTEFARLRERAPLVLPENPPPRRVCTYRLCLNPQPKTNPLRSEAYRRWVASLACAHCGRAGPTQCAHSDEGKGGGIKAGDDTSMPLCADAPGRRGCHSIIGASGMFTQAQRRTLERTYASRTRRMAWESGNWPKGWPAPAEAKEEATA